MTVQEAIHARHSVRQYLEKNIPDEIVKSLQDRVEECNRESGLHIQLLINEPRAFQGKIAHYGSFLGVTNYIAMIGHKGASLDEKCGYYGEQIVLLAQQLGLNTCWVGLNYSKINDALQVNKGEKVVLLIALGYGQTHGTAHRSKSVEKVTVLHGNEPEWFNRGIKSALLAPTAVNQQQFIFEYSDNKVIARSKLGFFSKVDLGIVKYHFEVGAGKENFEWA
ncbi:MAG: nitroreductase family protein [Bacteroidales bacterium]